MSLKHALLSLSYGPLRIVHRARRAVQSDTRGRLRAILFHDVPSEQEGALKATLEWLRKTWTFVSAEQFADMMSGSKPVIGDNLLLTFDDGFRSNRTVAEDILNPMGIRALFFTIPGLVELQSVDQQRRFIETNLYPPSSGEDVPNLARIAAMSYEDLRSLVDSGHTIGAHTATHARLSEVTDHGELVKEIIGCADRLRDGVGVEINHFAFGFGSLASFSPEALRVARSRFQYIYTGMRGDNASGVPPWAIRRDVLTPNGALWLAGAFTEGAADRRYRADLKTYEGWGSMDGSILTTHGRCQL
jgi:peptidoglycan/xylan/chitin deacetylase (PgdA/CDA1 family)